MGMSVFSGANPVSTAAVCGALCSSLVGYVWTVIQERLAPKRDLVARVGRSQLPMTDLMRDLERFARTVTAERYAGRSRSEITKMRGPHGSRIYMFERESGLRVSPPGEQLTKTERRIWNSCVSDGGGWAAYFELVKGGWLAADYVFVDGWGDLFITVGATLAPS